MYLRPGHQKVFDEAVSNLKKDGLTDELSIKRAIKDALRKHPQSLDTCAIIWNTLPDHIRTHFSSPEAFKCKKVSS